MNNKARKYTLVLVAVAVLFASVGYVIYTDLSSQKTTVVTDTDHVKKRLGDSVELDIEGEGNVEIVPILVPDMPVPQLGRNVTFPDDLTPDARSILTQKIQESESILREDPYDSGEWLRIGTLYRTVQDYNGAEEAWLFASALSPETTSAFYNLGDLYHFYLKQPAESEKMFLRSLENNPSYVPSYIGLHELYRYSYQTDTNKAENVLKEGIEQTENLDLYVSLARFYEEKGHIADAEIYYRKAIQKADALGRTDLKAMYEQSLSGLK